MENTIKNQTKFDYRTMKYCNLYIIKYKRKSFLLYLALSLITLALAVWSLIQDINAENGTFIFPILFLAFSFYMIYQGISVEKMLDRQLSQYFYNRKVSNQIVEMNEEKLLVTRNQDGTEGNAVEVEWLQVTEIHEIPQFYFLFIGKNTPIIIDKNPECMLEGTVDDMKNIIDEKAKMKPYKFLDKDIVKKPITYVHQEIVVDSTPVDAQSVENTEVENNNLEEKKTVVDESQDTSITDNLTDEKNDNQILDDVNKEK